MEGFKANPKMKSDIACYKEGGSVYKSRTHKEDPSEAAEDKAMVKKGIRQHEAAKHKGEEKTEIKLKNGGRSKKEKGAVSRYKKGGGVDAAEKGKPSGDKDKIKKVAGGSKKASAASASTGKKKESPKTDNKAAMPMMTASSTGPLPEAKGAPSGAMSPMAGENMFARGGFINEEPDDFTAVPTRPMARGARMRKRRPMPGAGMGAVSNAERQQIMDMFQGGPGNTMAGAMPQAGAAGLGSALNTGPMGAAAPAGPMANPPMSPQELDVMRGLQAIGSYCKGGKAY